jgi:hypothetical protein
MASIEDDGAFCFVLFSFPTLFAVVLLTVNFHSSFVRLSTYAPLHQTTSVAIRVHSQKYSASSHSGTESIDSIRVRLVGRTAFEQSNDSFTSASRKRNSNIESLQSNRTNSINNQPEAHLRIAHPVRCERVELYRWHGRSTSVIKHVWLDFKLLLHRPSSWKLLTRNDRTFDLLLRSVVSRSPCTALLYNTVVLFNLFMHFFARSKLCCSRFGRSNEFFTSLFP